MPTVGKGNRHAHCWKGQRIGLDVGKVKESSGLDVGKVKELDWMLERSRNQVGVSIG